MVSGLKTITYPVRDLAKAKRLYGGFLGVEPYIDQPYYVAFNAGGQDIGLDPNGHAVGMTGAIPYWQIDDIRASLEQLVAAGAVVSREVQDVGGGNLIANATDADGNVIGLVQAA
jgi:predicted enzyme related to lactoylglutathione lyase